MKCIVYNSGYKYQLKEAYVFINSGIIPPAAINTDYIALDMNGNLSISGGYAWDGPSGPTIDTKNFMRGSLAHDALYQLMREELLDHNQYREAADRLLQSLCKEDGMWALRAWWVYLGVRIFGDPSADPASRRPPEKAPDGCEC